MVLGYPLCRGSLTTDPYGRSERTCDDDDRWPEDCGGSSAGARSRDRGRAPAWGVLMVGLLTVNRSGERGFGIVVGRRADGFSAVDRGGFVLGSAQLDLHLARLSLLGLGDQDLQHSVVKLGLDAVGVDAVREGERSRERAEGPLEAVVALLGVVFGGALAGDGQRVVFELD